MMILTIPKGLEIMYHNNEMELQDGNNVDIVVFQLEQWMR